MKLDAYTASFMPRTEAEIRFNNVEQELKEVKANRKSNAALIVSIASVAVVFIFNLIKFLNYTKNYSKLLILLRT